MRFPKAQLRKQKGSPFRIVNHRTYVDAYPWLIVKLERRSADKCQDFLGKDSLFL